MQGGHYPYRITKTGLNAATKSLALDLQLTGHRVGVLSVDPGWSRTEMGSSKAPLSVEESVLGLLQVVEGFKLEHSGGFLDIKGGKIPW